MVLDDGSMYASAAKLSNGCQIGNLYITDGGLSYGTYDAENNTTTGVKITTSGLWAASGTLGKWHVNGSNMSIVDDSDGVNIRYTTELDEFGITYTKKIGVSLEFSYVPWETICNLDEASDSRVKKNVELLSTKYEKFFDSLTPTRYQYINGTSGRYHTGFIAQEVVDALTQAELDTQQFAGVMLFSPGTKKECWHLRKNEFVALNTWQIQKAKARIFALEETITKLENRISQLENKERGKENG